MTGKKILILGAGLAGLSAAWHLQKRGIDCEVLEKEEEAGGLCRSKEVNGFIFDHDGHLLHFRHDYTKKLVHDLLGDNLASHNRDAWVRNYNSLSRFPFQANLYGMPPRIIRDCISGFIRTLGRGQAARCANFRQWIESAFGDGIAKHFMVPYNSKFWTVAPEKLTCEWLDGFIPVPSLEQVLRGAAGRSGEQLGYSSVFWYPREGGISCLPDAMVGEIKNIRFNSPVTGIDFKKREVSVGSGGKKKRFDHIISTLPLPELLRLVKDMPAGVRSLFGKLEWNSIFNLNLGIDRPGISDRHWIYFPEKKLSFFRVGFFNSFSSALAPADKSSLYAEVSYSRNKPMDKKKAAKRIVNDLKAAGVLDKDDKIVAEDVNDIKYGYPIYDFNYNSARAGIVRYLGSKNVIPCGRYGSWRYMSMEDAMLDGRRAAEALKV